MPARFPRRLLIDKVHIQRTSGSSVDERGIESNDWANVSSNVPCRFTLINEVENRDGRNTVVRSFNLVLPGDTDVKASDRIYEASSNKYYEIESVSEGRKMDGEIYYKSLSLLHRE
tara:strand:+ start:7998 stop:8345 length:348 start_codon:yes stop_codon:yes gene_type:complete